MAKRNLTLQVEEDVIRRVRILAAERDTSISGLFTALVEQADDQGREAERRAAHARWRAHVQRINDRNRGVAPQPRDWTRDDLYADRLDRFS